jgi:hypothetical protein
MRKDIKAAGDIGLNGGTEGPVFTPFTIELGLSFQLEHLLD